MSLSCAVMSPCLGPVCIICALHHPWELRCSWETEGVGGRTEEYGYLLGLPGICLGDGWGFQASGGWEEGLALHPWLYEGRGQNRWHSVNQQMKSLLETRDSQSLSWRGEYLPTSKEAKILRRSQSQTTHRVWPGKFLGSFSTTGGLSDSTGTQDSPTSSWLPQKDSPCCWSQSRVCSG
jgi:hypothetical protein